MYCSVLRRVVYDFCVGACTWHNYLTYLIIQEFLPFFFEKGQELMSFLLI